MALPYNNNTYKVAVLSIHDGDTFTGEVDLGFRAKITQTFRLEGLNAPEVVGKEKQAGRASREFFQNIINNTKEVLVRASKQEKYGRWLATVLCDGVNVNERLIKEGYAVPMVY